MEYLPDIEDLCMYCGALLTADEAPSGVCDECTANMEVKHDD